MVNDKDIQDIGFQYFNYLEATREMLPFTDEELEVIARYEGADNKRELGDEFLQQYSELELKYLCVYGGNKAVDTQSGELPQAWLKS